METVQVLLDADRVEPRARSEFRVNAKPLHVARSEPRDANTTVVLVGKKAACLHERPFTTEIEIKINYIILYIYLQIYYSRNRV